MRETIKLAVRLMAFAMVSALMLAVVNVLTKDKIAENNRASVSGARAQVIGDYDFEETGADLTGYQYIKNVYAATSDDGIVGYVYDIESSGFGGIISLNLGVWEDGTISGIAVSSHTETKGLGTDAQEPFLQSIVGLNAAGGRTSGAAQTAAPDAGTSAEPTPDAATSASTEAEATAEATADAATAASPNAEPTPDAATSATTVTTTQTAAASTDASTSATGTETQTAAASDAQTGATTDATTSATTGATGTAVADETAGSAVAEVDGMTGATVSSNAIKNAVAEALNHFKANYLGGGASAQ